MSPQPVPTRKNETVRAQNRVQPSEEIWQTIRNALTPPAVATREKEAIIAAPIAKAPARHPRLPASAVILAARVRYRRGRAEVETSGCAGSRESGFQARRRKLLV